MDPEQEEEGEWEQMDTGLADGCGQERQRVVLHFDLDCFYAQVEMIRNPELCSKPLGVQQKNIVVTCNYVARARGLTKLMLVKEALEKCPDLVLVRGEDLTYYREVSYQVTELLMSYCPLVERLGFDENFMDVTEMVESRMEDTDLSNLSFVGHVYGHDGSAISVQDHMPLALGSVIAAELRGALHSRLGLTSCAGVASSKLLAKLVSGTFKPNEQTTLLPDRVADLMSSLSGLNRVPGIGYRTTERLKLLGVLSVRDLQLCPLNQLGRVFGDENAKRMQNLARGIDPSPVTPTGPPQSLSDEDSFGKISTATEAESKIAELLTSLSERMRKDGRLPQTLRLVLRRSDAPSRWFSRESRQCNVPTHTAHKIIQGCPEAVPQLVSIAMKLLSKMVNLSEPFHLTLLNVCFTNLRVRNSGKSTISNFFTHRAPAAGQEADRGAAVCGAASGLTQSGTDKTQSINKPSSSSSGLISVPQPVHLDQDSRTSHSIPEGPRRSRLPPQIDPDVFRSLPEEIQSELMTSFQSRDALPESSVEPDPEPNQPLQQDTTTSKPGLGPDFPPDVDPVVFSQLPPDVRSELLMEWRRSKPTLKITSKSTSKRQATQKRPPSKTPQNSSLLKYFKPN